MNRDLLCRNPEEGLGRRQVNHEEEKLRQIQSITQKMKNKSYCSSIIMNRLMIKAGCIYNKDLNMISA